MLAKGRVFVSRRVGDYFQVVLDEMCISNGHACKLGPIGKEVYGP